MDYSFTRYLAAKKSVDDRALSHQVWQAFARALPSEPQVLEIGAGIGTMLERLVERRVLSAGEYTLLDSQPENIAEARLRLPRWAAARGGHLSPDQGGADLDAAGLRLSVPGAGVRVSWAQADVFDFIPRTQGRVWDALIAHAFLDLLDVPRALPGLFSLLRPGGLFYFTVNFDGGTLFEPEIDRAFDDQVERLYHRSMDERLTRGQLSGDSRSGRHLFGHLRALGAEILAAGASDWVVYAGPGGYPTDEAYFLHFILHTLEGALRGHPELEPERFEHWIAERHAQVERGELVYIAHQLDFVGRRDQKVVGP